MWWCVCVCVCVCVSSEHSLNSGSTMPFKTHQHTQYPRTHTLFHFTDIHNPSHIHTHCHTHSPFISHKQANRICQTWSHTLSLSLSLSHTHTQTHTVMVQLFFQRTEVAQQWA